MQYLTPIFVAFCWLAALAAALLLWRQWAARQSIADRLYDDERQTTSTSDRPMSLLRRWLFLAGYRHPQAPAIYVLTLLLGIAAGVVFLLTFYLTGLNEQLARSTELVPGGVGEVFLPAVWVGPWFLFLLPSLLSTLAVRSARRARVESIEQDLPLALELFATLSEAGMAFDAALERMLGTRLGERPLAGEFRAFQGDLLAGRPRVQALRRLSQRIDVPSMSVFVSALVQAEQLGMGIAQVLRRQADDLRDRRRERANTFAQQLPVKRIIPLVVCFLPGLFVWTLGPVFVQLFQIAEKFVQVPNLP